MQFAYEHDANTKVIIHKFAEMHKSRLPTWGGGVKNFNKKLSQTSFNY